MTHHGPIVRSDGKRWIAFAMMNKPVEALQQSFLRTKATDLESFMRIAEFKANSSNDTIFADDKGEIAYLHPQFVPRRDDRFDYTKPVDGSDPATDWRGLHAISELPNTIDPPNGWVQNTNTWPYRAAGKYSPIRRNSRDTWTRSATISASFTRCSCSRGAAAGRSISSRPRLTTAISRALPS